MRQWQIRRPLRLVLVAGLAVLCFGCQGRGEVTGQVTWEGTAITFGRITFHGLDGKRQVGGASIINGDYRVTGLAPGEYAVTVESFSGRPSHQPVSSSSLPPPPLPAEAAGEIKAAAAHQPGPAVPRHYGNPKKSGLQRKITEGLQTLNFELSQHDE